MTTRWKDHENEMSDVVTAEYAEPIEHRPMRSLDVNGRPEPDPTRAIQTIAVAGGPLSGIFDWAHQEVQFPMGHAENRMPGAAKISSRKAIVWVERRNFNNDLRQGDRLLIVEENVELEITDVLPDGQGRLELKCNQCGRAKQ